MAESDPELSRADARRRAGRDVERQLRREPDARFWRSLGLIGSVGWPIVTLSTGSAVAGHYLDQRWQTGVRFTLLLLFVGAGLGTWMAFRTIRRQS